MAADRDTRRSTSRRSRRPWPSLHGGCPPLSVARRLHAGERAAHHRRFADSTDFGTRMVGTLMPSSGPPLPGGPSSWPCGQSAASFPRASRADEDAGMTFSTRRLAYQAAHENARRWLSFDLLTGGLNESHHSGTTFCVTARANRTWRSSRGSVRPGRRGSDHYVTSDRFLDDDLEVYPTWAHGGNRRDRYADVETPRAARC